MFNILEKFLILLIALSSSSHSGIISDSKQNEYITMKPKEIMTTSSPEEKCVNCISGAYKERTKFYFDWRKKVIIACTVLAALECCIVLFTIVYWDKIRWFLWKITCPCISRATSTSSTRDQGIQFEIIAQGV